MRLYFDCCCYNRSFDDLSQNRIHDESGKLQVEIEQKYNQETLSIV